MPLSPCTYESAADGRGKGDGGREHVRGVGAQLVRRMVDRPGGAFHSRGVRRRRRVRWADGTVFHGACFVSLSVLRWSRGVSVDVDGSYIYGWFIFTVFVWLATLRATLVFNVLILTVWIAFLCLATSYYYNTGGEKPMPQYHLQTAGGAFGIIASFLAWWVMLAGCLDKETNRYVW